MIRVIKTDLFRLFKSKSFYVFPLFVILFLFLQSVLSVSSVQSETGEDNEGVNVGIYKADQETDGVRINAEIKSDTGEAAREELNVKMSIPGFLGSLTDELVLFFVGIILVIFCTAETRAGFIKNAAGAVSNRAYMPLSKVLVGIVMMIMYVIEYAVLYGLIQVLVSVFSGKSIEFVHFKQGEAGEFFSYLFVCVLIHIAMIVIIVMVHELTYSRALGIVFAFALTSGLVEKFLEGGVYLLRHFFGILQDFDIAKYELLTNMCSGYDSEAYHGQLMVVMSVIYIAIFMFLAIFISRKKEIR